MHLITQNVDALHTKAGSSKVIELHGCMHRVRCLNCNQMTPRHDLQKVGANPRHLITPQQIISDNPNWTVDHSVLAPDGDVDITPSHIESFRPPRCLDCGTVSLIPDVIFFGDNVPKAIVERCFSFIDECDALLVLGTTLQVRILS